MKLHTFKIVSHAKSNCLTESEFRAELKQQGIDILFRRNEEGRIYGATFIDHTTRSVLNGSRLGKEFSANVFNELFNKQEDNSEKTENNTHPQPETSQQNNSQNADKQQEKPDFYDTNLGEIFSSIIPEPAFNPDDNQMTIKPKKKKKRKFGRQV